MKNHLVHIVLLLLFPLLTRSLTYDKAIYLDSLSVETDFDNSVYTSIINCPDFNSAEKSLNKRKKDHQNSNYCWVS